MRALAAPAQARSTEDLLADFVEQLEEATEVPLPTERDSHPDARLAARDSLIDYAIYASGGRWKPAAHLELLAQKLEAVERGEITRLVISLPARHGKSELAAVHFPVWYLGRHPDHEFMIIAYGDELATKHGRRTRNFLNALGPELWGTRVASDSSAAGRWNIAGHEGGMVATGIGGTIMGKGAHCMVIDDPYKNWEESQSPTIRQKVKDEYQATLRTRLAPGGAIIIIHTRYHDDDLIGWLQSQEKTGEGEHWEELRLPALAEENDPLGRSKGEPLWPERFSKRELESVIRVQGAIKAAAMYQQRPAKIGAGIFKREWFTRIVEPHEVPGHLVWVRYWDLANSITTSAHFTASFRVAFDADGTLYIAAGMRWQKEWPDTRALIIQTAKFEGPGVAIGVEKVGFQNAAWQELMREKDLVAHTILPVPVDRDKVSRALPWAARAAAGKVVLVQGAWIGDFLDEAAMFPNGEYDDQVDGVSGGVMMLGFGAEEEAQDDYEPDPSYVQ